eukprot:125047-Pleurochrysis_carterae.AAC.2
MAPPTFLRANGCKWLHLHPLSMLQLMLLWELASWHALFSKVISAAVSTYAFYIVSQLISAVFTGTC